jgi:hypothetical protein
MTKLTIEKKLEIALDMLCAKLTIVEVCCKHGVRASCACHIKNRALEVLRAGIGEPAKQSGRLSERLLIRLADMEQLVGDQALAIGILRKQLRGRSRRYPKPVSDSGP